MSYAVTFGEIMLRLSVPGHGRFGQSDRFDACFGGGEANVAASLAAYGVPAEFVTRLPANPIADAALAQLHAAGVQTNHVVRGGERIGTYFLEHGSAARPSRVVYDRAHSGMATIPSAAIDWASALKEASWFHFTGITPAISEAAAEACLVGVRAAHDAGIPISCDLNYRSKLWRYGKSPAEVMESLVSMTSVIVANEEDAARVFGIDARGARVDQGEVDAESYRTVAEALMERFPRCELVAITLRASHSASHNTWSGVLFDGKSLRTTTRYEIQPIVDRVGAGDAFAGGLVYRLITDPDDLQGALDFAVAASCLKHSIPGDFNRVSVDEVNRLAAGNASGRVVR